MLDLNKNIFISASAGTGKTTKLKDILVDLILSGIEPKKIVTITFTNAAVEEIKNRVSSEFINSSYNIKDLNISTMHSFFSKILKQNAALLNISPTFDVLDEVRSEFIYKKIAFQVMRKTLANNSFNKLFEIYDFDSLYEMLLKLNNKYTDIKYNLNLSLSDFKKEEEEAEINTFKIKIGLCFVDNINYILNNQSSNEDDKLEIFRKYLADIITKDFVLDKYNVFLNTNSKSDFKKFLSFFKNLDFRNFRTNLGSNKFWENKTVVSEAIGYIRDISKYVNDYKIGEDFVIDSTVGLKYKLIELFKEVYKEYENYKNEKECMDFNDIEIFTLKLFEDNKHLLAYYKQKYLYYLIDEFQDTSFIQSKILSLITPRTIIVGDSKQSIYRFRNADVSVFIDKEKTSDSNLILSKNYRSCNEIINVVNLIFSNLFKDQNNCFDPKYGYLECGVEGSGVVKFFRFSENIEEAYCAVKIIKEGLLKGNKFEDYTLLFNKKKKIAIFEQIFKEESIPYVVLGYSDRDDSIKRFQSIIKIIINPYDNLSFIEVFKLPFFLLSDDAIFKFKDHKYVFDIFNEDLSGYDLSNDDLISINRLKKFLLDINTLKYKLSFTDLIITIMKRSRFIDSISLINPGHEFGFSEAILNLSLMSENSLDNFCKMLENFKYRNNLNVNGCVKLMTIHAAKGLNFPIVILPFLNDDLRGGGTRTDLSISYNGKLGLKLADDYKYIRTPMYNSISEEESLAYIAESKRIFYVAMTRARKELYMLTSGKEKKQSWASWAVTFLDEKLIEDKEQKVDEKNITRIYYRLPELDMDTVVNTKKGKIHINTTMLKDYCQYGEDFLKKRYFKGFGAGILIHKSLEEDDTSYLDSDLKEIVDNFKNTELGKSVFANSNFKVEHDFILNLKNVFLKGRIDRINISEDSIWVIDYKTFVDSSNLDGYKAQIFSYMYYLKKAFKNKEIIGSFIDIVNFKEYRYVLDEEWFLNKIESFYNFITKEFF